MMPINERARGMAGAADGGAGEAGAEAEQGDERLGMDVLNEIQALQKEMAPLQVGNRWSSRVYMFGV